MQDAEGNPTTNFARMGGRLGTLAGGVSGLGRGIASVAPVGSNARRWGMNIMGVGEGAGYPMQAPFRTLGRITSTISPRTAAGTTGVSRFFNYPVGLRSTAMNTLGRRIGLGGLGVMGANEMIGGLERRMLGGADRYLANNLPPLVDSLTQRAHQEGHQFLAEHGLLGQGGQLSLGGAIGNPFDHVLRGIGLDPANLSGLQKLSILGGMGVLGGGLMSGHAGVAGLGGLAAAGGALPQLLQRFGGGGGQGGPGPGGAGGAAGAGGGPAANLAGTAAGPGGLQARNELLHQMRLQGRAPWPEEQPQQPF